MDRLSDLRYARDVPAEDNSPGARGRDAVLRGIADRVPVGGARLSPEPHGPQSTRLRQHHGQPVDRRGPQPGPQVPQAPPAPQPQLLQPQGPAGGRPRRDDPEGRLP